MHRTSMAAIITLSALFSAAAQAEGYYYGGNFAFLEYSEDGISDDASLDAIYGRLGMNFNEYLSAEARVGFGVGDDSVNVQGIDVDVELDNFFGAYLRGGYPVAESFFPYAVVGYTSGKLTASVFGFSESETESDTSYGLGADIDVTENLIVNVEYMNYLDKDGGQVDGFAIGLAGKF